MLWLPGIVNIYGFWYSGHVENWYSQHFELVWYSEHFELWWYREHVLRPNFHNNIINIFLILFFDSLQFYLPPEPLVNKDFLKHVLAGKK